MPEHDHDKKLRCSDGAADALKSRSALTAWAMKARTSGVKRAVYFSTTSGLETDQTGAVVDGERVLESARCAVGAAIVSQCRSSGIDRLLKNLSDRNDER